MLTLEENNNSLKQQITRLSTQLNITTLDNASNLEIVKLKSTEHFGDTESGHVERNENSSKEDINQTKADDERFEQCNESTVTVL
ncbi:hypothetical protein AM593_02889, partial [Mytilus galloprovincialis]